MTFIVRAYKDMMEGTTAPAGIKKEDGFEDTKATLRGEHHAERIETLKQPRRHQIQFIEKAREMLHQSNQADRGFGQQITILAGGILCE